MVVERWSPSGTGFSPAALYLLPIGLELLVQLPELANRPAKLFPDASQRFRGVRFRFRAGLQGLTPRKELQRQAVELIEHIAEEPAKLVLSCMELVQHDVRSPDVRGFSEID